MIFFHFYVKTGIYCPAIPIQFHSRNNRSFVYPIGYIAGWACPNQNLNNAIVPKFIFFTLV